MSKKIKIKLEADTIISKNIISKIDTKVVLFLFFSISFLTNCYFIYLYTTHEDQSSAESSKYPLLSKRIFKENQNDIIINFRSLRYGLETYLLTQNKQVGIYFEYLPSGISVGINATEKVKLSSLSKIPLVMSILKKVEKHKLSLDSLITIKKENLDSKFGTLYEKGEGSKFTIRELIDYCLKESDNTAYYALFDQLSTDEIMDVYDGLEIEVDQNTADKLPTVSPKSYSSVLRSLYLSSYLSRENSEYILDILTKTIFKDKIPAGLPSDVMVAHKIGVFYKADDISEEVFTDCGIVYVPSRPYVLCIFSKKSEEETKTVMAHISKMVYSYVNSVQGGN